MSDHPDRGIINGYDVARALNTVVLNNGGRDVFNGWTLSVPDDNGRPTFPRSVARSFESTAAALGLGPKMAAVCLDGREQWWVWIDARHADAAEALTMERTGKHPRVLRGAHPCREVYLSTEVCARPAKDGDDLCGLHRGVAKRVEARQAEWQARREKDRAERERQDEAVERAKAELAARGDILDEAGIVRATIDVHAGRSGDALVTMPIESILALLDEFGAAIGLDRQKEH